MTLYKTPHGSYPKKMQPVIEAITELINEPSTTEGCKTAFHDKLSLVAISEIVHKNVHQEVSRIMGALWDIAASQEDSFIKKVNKVQEEIDNLDPQVGLVKVMIATRFMLQRHLQKSSSTPDPIALSLFNPETQNPESIYRYALLAWQIFKDDPFNHQAGEHIVLASDLLETIVHKDPRYKTLQRKINDFSLQQQSAE
ncbi:MAG: hypothetical protein R3B71_01380 [Candidatus Gracilibacteria bacterium]